MTSRKSYEKFVVLTAELSPVLEWAIKSHQANYPHALGNQPSDKTTADTVGYGAFKWLSQETGAHPRTISRIVRNETTYTSLSLADELLTGLGRQHMLGSEIKILKNPLSRKSSSSRLRGT